MEQAENVIGFRVSFMRCKSPSELYKEIKPENAKCYSIPQTQGDCWWFWFKFENKEDLSEYYESIKNTPVNKVFIDKGEKHTTPLSYFVMEVTEKEFKHWVREEIIEPPLKKNEYPELSLDRCIWEKLIYLHPINDVHIVKKDLDKLLKKGYLIVGDKTKIKLIVK